MNHSCFKVVKLTFLLKKRKIKTAQTAHRPKSMRALIYDHLIPWKLKNFTLARGFPFFALIDVSFCFPETERLL